MQAKVNEKTYMLELEDGAVIIDGKKQLTDIKKTSANSISLIREGVQTSAQILEINREEKKVILLIDQSTYEVELKDKMDLLLEDLGMSEMLAKKMPDLSSPMPGLIVKINVNEGDAFAKGDTLLILEAMKMENSLKATAEGVVSAIEAKEGDSVEKGQTLITFE